MTVDVKEAVRSAIAYVKEFQELFPMSDTRLEETEYDDKKQQWVVTLSFIDNPKLGSRKVKEFRVGWDGKVLSMKDHQPF